MAMDLNHKLQKRAMFDLCPKCLKHPVLKSCVHICCSRCCEKESEEKGELCQAHSLKRQKKDADAKLVEIALKKRERQTTHKKKAQSLKRGLYVEEAFEELNDTVIIWSLRRYFGNCEYSQDHLEGQRRAQRLHVPPPNLKSKQSISRESYGNLADYLKAKKVDVNK